VGTILFTAIGISLVVIAAHGAFRVPDDLFLDDSEVRRQRKPVRLSYAQHATDTAHHHAVARLRVALRVCPAQIDNRSVFAFLSAKV
jgi:hypothetical protein